jgi:hypothetical protein
MKQGSIVHVLRSSARPLPRIVGSVDRLRERSQSMTMNLFSRICDH